MAAVTGETVCLIDLVNIMFSSNNISWFPPLQQAAGGAHLDAID